MLDLAARYFALLVLALGGAGKLQESGMAALSLSSAVPVSFGVANRLVLGVATLELVLAASLLIAPYRRKASMGGLALCLVFGALVLRRAWLGESGPCGCLGAVLELTPPLQVLALGVMCLGLRAWISFSSAADRQLGN